MKISEKSLGIVAGGGGMRCAYSAGVLYALAKELELKAPKYLVGSSGTAATALMYALKEYELLKRVWIKDLSLEEHRRLIARWRLLKIFDVDYLVDEIIKPYERPAHDKILRESRTNLFLAATGADNGRVDFFDVRKEKKHAVYEILRASKAIPVAFRRKVMLAGRRYVDGAIGAPLVDSVRFLEEKGAKNVLVIKNEYGIPFTNKVMFWIYSWLVNKRLGKSIRRYVRQNDRDILALEGVNVFILEPSRRLKASSLSLKREKLEDAFNLGVSDVKTSGSLHSFLAHL
ncbi:MAG: patatin-like phospholipase family protein [Candidatus Paceibacterota bacterium]